MEILMLRYSGGNLAILEFHLHSRKGLSGASHGENDKLGKAGRLDLQPRRRLLSHNQHSRVANAQAISHKAGDEI
jgi:hypothetical protein